MIGHGSLGDILKPDFKERTEIFQLGKLTECNKIFRRKN